LAPSVRGACPHFGIAAISQLYVLRRQTPTRFIISRLQELFLPGPRRIAWLMIFKMPTSLRSNPMVRTMAFALTACALFVLVGNNLAEAQAQKTQMVKGTIKTVDPSKDLLIVNQKVKNEFVERELSILSTTEFVLINGSDKTEGVGNAGLKLLEGKEGASVQVKCDKDVNVLKVTVTIKK
jgi:hypothetical protein